ncbi:hypothetical protein, partial [Pseudophaeobacter profundi]|uniref:hypothetical protein n=1 Tax=Pseudophaeobacter profundi TaxID=3034152 RepID=UPI00242EB517
QHPLNMRTSVLVASFALLAVALLECTTPVCAATIATKSSDKSAFAKNAANSAESASKIVKKDGLGNLYAKETAASSGNTSASAGASQSDNELVYDDCGNAISKQSSSKSLSSSTSSYDNSSSKEVAVAAPPPCGCK